MAGKIRKYLSYAVLSGFLFCVAVVILAKVLVTPERVRNTLVPVVEKYLHCKVNIHSVDVSLYSGVSLTGLELLSNDNTSMLLSADKVLMRYQFWPLFEQRIVIDEVSLVRPQINIARFADGEFNFQHILFEDNAVEKKGHELLHNRENIDLVITKIFVDQGEVLFKDYRFSAIPQRYKISNMGLNISDFSLNTDFDIKAWGKLNGDPVDFAGMVNLRSMSYDLQVNISHLNMVQFQPYYRQAINGNLDSLKINVDGRIWGNDQQFNSKAVVDLHQLDATLTPGSRYPLRASALGIDYALGYDRRLDHLEVSKLGVAIDGLSINAHGVINKLTTTSDVDLQVAAKKLSLRAIMALLPPDIARSLGGYGLAGTLGLKMDLLGRANAGLALVHSAVISLDAVQASIADIRPALSGVIEIVGKRVQSQNLSLTTGDNRMDLTMTCDNWLAKKPLYRLQLAADTFTTVGLSNRAGGEISKLQTTDARYPTKQVGREISEPQPINLPFNVGGDVKIKQAHIAFFDLTDVRLHYELRDDVLEYDRFKGTLANGFFATSGQIDLSRQGFTYSGQVDVQKIALSALLPQLDPAYADSMSGLLTSSFSYSGAGTLWLRAQQNLSAVGDFTITDGKMGSNALLHELSGVLGTTELNIFSFAQGSGTFEKKTGGHVQYSAEFSGSKARLVPSGWWNIDGTLKSNLDVYLAPKVRDSLVANPNISQYMQDENGWGFIPLMVSGTPKAPRVQFNLAKVQDQACSKVVNSLLNKKLGGDADHVAPATQIIESTLKDLLNK